MDRPGLFFQNQGDTALQQLPLSDLRVQVVIVDTSARVTLTARYINAQDNATQRCKYVFPVPSSAAICAFSMQIADGRTIKGIAKEKDAAREEYEEALRAGTAAALVNYVTDDIFTISVGCIPAHSTATTNTTYVLSLHNDINHDDIRFQLPRGVGERYGTVPAELHSASAPAAQTKIKLTAQIQMSGPIISVASPSHPADITETKYVHNGQPSRRRSTVKFRSSSFLDRDFLLIIQAEDLDKPRCFAELQEDHQRPRHCSLALQFTLVPKFILPQISSQEYVFILDRSGSMSGGRIEQAKETLLLLLKMLPKQGTRFNVFAFDDAIESVWPRSRAYDSATSMMASSWVTVVGARGGTEMAYALQAVLATRETSMPTAVFLLTDGEVYDTTPIQIVDSFVKQATAESPLRVFTLGIGDGISTATCDGIARAGNGKALYATSSDQIALLCVHLFVAGRTPFVRNVSIDWGIPEDYLASAATVAFPHHEPSTSRTVGIRPLSNTQQVPHIVHEIHAGTRMNIFAIIALKRPFSPKEVTLRGELRSDGTTFQTTVPIRGVHLADIHHGRLLVHTLAAWRLVQAYAEGGMPLPSPLLPTSTSDEVRKAVLVHLGEKHQLVTQHTSFVAIESWEDIGPEPPRPTPISRTGSGAPWDPEPEQEGDTGRRDSFTFTLAISNISNLLWNILGGGHPQSARGSAHSRAAPGAWPDSPLPTVSTSRGDLDDDVDVGQDGYESDHTFTTLSSLESHTWSDWSDPPTPGTPPRPDDEDNAPTSPRLEPVNLAPDAIQQRMPARAVSQQSQHQQPEPVPREVVRLCSLQTFDGSFRLGEALGRIVGEAAIREANNLQVEDKVWATAISIGFIRKRMDSQKELRDDLLAKALEFLQETGLDVDDLLRKASRFV